MKNTTILQPEQYLAPTYARYPVAFVRGQGSVLYDATGREYIDFGSGIAVNTFGHADPAWLAAVQEQMQTLGHTSNLYHTEPAKLLATQLCQRTGMHSAFFSNSGAEANECMIKAARKWSADTFGDPARSVILTLAGSFHGRTLATLAATGQEPLHQDFAPLPPGFRHVPPNHTEALAQAVQQPDVCAVLLELVQGEGGVVPLDPAFVQAAAQLCQQHKLLLLLDEVQTGNGRTGALYAFQHHAIQPDSISTAKGLAGGLPLGATLFGERCASTLQPGTHGSTFGGNPICAAAALHVLNRIDSALLQGVLQREACIRAQLQNTPGVLSITGQGLMLGLETLRPAKEIATACLEAGLLVLTAKQKIRLLPALNIPMELLTRGLAILTQVLASQ